MIKDKMSLPLIGEVINKLKKIISQKSYSLVVIPKLNSVSEVQFKEIMIIDNK